MTIELIGIITLMLGVIGVFRPPSFIVYLFFSSLLLGSAAAFILDSLGGTNIPPAHLLLGFLIYRLLSVESVRKGIIPRIKFGRPGFWLLLTVIYGAVTAYIWPRLFAGQTIVIPVRSQGYTIALEPSTANLTQAVYFVGDFVCFIVLSGYAASSLAARKVLTNAALFCVILNLIFAALDMVTYFTNTTELLSFIRNATYSLLNETELAGFKRIVGSFVEASAFGSMSLGFFAFTGTLWMLGVRTRLTAALTVLTFLALIFSTSTTAYVGLFVVLAIAYVQNLVRISHRSAPPQVLFFVLGAPIILATVAIAIAFSDTYSTYLGNLLDTFILDKMSSASGVERSSWNQQAIQNFLDTFGFGVGIGSLRASSFPVAVISNFGLLGTVLFGLFFVTIFVRRAYRRQMDPVNDAYRRASRAACLSWLVTATLSGALVDLGLAFFAFAALASSEPVIVQEPTGSVSSVQVLLGS
jgi:hypothetical protein